LLTEKFLLLLSDAATAALIFCTDLLLRGDFVSVFCCILFDKPDETDDRDVDECDCGDKLLMDGGLEVSWNFVICSSSNERVENPRAQSGHILAPEIGFGTILINVHRFYFFV